LTQTFFQLNSFGDRVHAMFISQLTVKSTLASTVCQERDYINKAVQMVHFVLVFQTMTNEIIP